MPLALHDDPSLPGIWNAAASGLGDEDFIKIQATERHAMRSSSPLACSAASTLVGLQGWQLLGSQGQMFSERRHAAHLDGSQVGWGGYGGAWSLLHVQQQQLLAHLHSM